MEQVERNEKIVAMADAGHTYKEIGITFGISRQMVQMILSRSGYRRREPSFPKDVSNDDVFQYIIEHKKQFLGHGPFPTEIAKKFEIPAGRVEGILRALQDDEGKITMIGSGVNRKIIVSGSEWTYSPPVPVPDSISD